MFFVSKPIADFLNTHFPVSLTVRWRWEWKNVSTLLKSPSTKKFKASELISSKFVVRPCSCCELPANFRRNPFCKGVLNKWPLLVNCAGLREHFELLWIPIASGEFRVTNINCRISELRMTKPSQKGICKRGKFILCCGHHNRSKFIKSISAYLELGILKLTKIFFEVTVCRLSKAFCSS